MLSGRRIDLELHGVSRRPTGKEIASDQLGPCRNRGQPLAFLLVTAPHDELSPIDANLAFLALPLEWGRAEATGRGLQRDLVRLARRRRLLSDKVKRFASRRESLNQGAERFICPRGHLTAFPFERSTYQ